LNVLKKALTGAAAGITAGKKGIKINIMAPAGF
jgi:hypothetical protein